MMTAAAKARFSIGQVVKHKVFGYRGLVFDVDPVFSHDDDWYETVACSNPPKDQPWYHVLVDGAEHITYVAERNLLESENANEPIEHPLLGELFQSRHPGAYQIRQPLH